jgi:mono/diheme cytochrome c family protein
MSSFDTTVCRARAIAARSARAACSAAVLVCALIAPSPASLAARQSRVVGERVYTNAQATRGQRTYNQRCVSCHGDNLEGIEGPELAGSAFIADFDKQPLAQLVGKIRDTMPQDEPGTLTPQQASDVTAYILKANQFPDGRAELRAETAVLKQMTWPPSPTGSPAASSQSASAAAPQAPTWSLTGNLQQVMRGALFQNSNILFNVQTHDPGEKPDPARKSAGTSIDWVGWGSGIYTGWEAVDNAAVTLAEVTTLLLTPGRRCQNGKPVPVDRADWIKFSMDLLEASRKSYRASQTRSQEAVSDSTNDLADACLACHQVYRDKRAPGSQPGDPPSMALRCMP